VSPYPLIQYPRFTAARKKCDNWINKRFRSFKTCAKWERDVTWWNPAGQTRPALDSYSFVPVPTLKRQNPLLSYVREREREREREKEKEKVNCKYTKQCTVHFIITLFNVGNVLLCVIYQLNFTVFMYLCTFMLHEYHVIQCVRKITAHLGYGT
jgi:hypothetical protein